MPANSYRRHQRVVQADPLNNIIWQELLIRDCGRFIRRHFLSRVKPLSACFTENRIEQRMRYFLHLTSWEKLFWNFKFKKVSLTSSVDNNACWCLGLCFIAHAWVKMFARHFKVNNNIHRFCQLIENLLLKTLFILFNYI